VIDVIKMIVISDCFSVIIIVAFVLWVIYKGRPQNISQNWPIIPSCPLFLDWSKPFLFPFPVDVCTWTWRIPPISKCNATAVSW